MAKLVFRVLFFSALIAVSACTTTGNVPPWVDTAPEDTSEYLYYVGTGTSGEGAAGKAATDAAASIASEIVRDIGLRVVQDTTEEARTAYAEFKEALARSLSGETATGLDGLRIAGQWNDEDGSSEVVHLLAEWDLSSYEALKSRLSALFEEKAVTVSPSEIEGDQLFAGQRYYRAAVSFVEAALEASVSDEQDAALKFERNIAKAESAVRRLEIEESSAPGFVYVGEDFDEDFAVRLKSGDSPASGLPVTVNYKVLRANGRKSVRTHTVLTDENGLASFRAPAPEWVGIEKVTFFLDMRAIIEPLESVSFDLLQYVDGLEQAVAEKQIELSYEIYSRAIEVPTCVMVMDVDRSGNPLDKTDTASGIVSVLEDAGFDVYMIPVDYRMTAVGDSELIRMIREQYGSLYERIIFGTAEISSFDESGGSVNVKVTGRIKAVELETGRVLFSASEQKGARGGNNSSTIAAAFLSLGKMYGNKLISDLP